MQGGRARAGAFRPNKSRQETRPGQECLVQRHKTTRKSPGDFRKLSATVGGKECALSRAGPRVATEETTGNGVTSGERSVPRAVGELPREGEGTRIRNSAAESRDTTVTLWFCSTWFRLCLKLSSIMDACARV